MDVVTALLPGTGSVGEEALIVPRCTKLPPGLPVYANVSFQRLPGVSELFVQDTAALYPEAGGMNKQDAPGRLLDAVTFLNVGDLISSTCWR